jgi:hypothetical protein
VREPLPSRRLCVGINVNRFRVRGRWQTRRSLSRSARRP